MEVTDRTLVIVGVFTFVVVLGSISLVLVELGGFEGVTGFAITNESIGYVNISIRSNTAVTLTTSVIDFGSGSVAVSGATPVNSSVGTNPSTFDDPGPFTLQNDGNVYVNVTVNGSTHVELFGASTPPQNYSFAIEVAEPGTEDLEDSCLNYGSGTGQNFYNISISNATQPGGITMSNSAQMVCPNMSYVDANDKINVSIYFNFTNEVTSNTTYDDTLIFFIASLGHG